MSKIELNGVAGTGKGYAMLSLNEHYMKFYAGREVHRWHGATLDKLIVHGWSAGLCKEQVLIDCMNHGYALCVAEPAIERVWKWWDDSYAEYCKAEQEAIANPVYTICYIDECGTEHERDHEFPNKEHAIGFCQGMFKGREDLVSGITLTGSDGTDEDGSTMGIY